MGHAGVFAPGMRLELIGGELYEMPAIGPAHAGIVKRLNRILDRQIGEAAIVSVQDPVTLDGHSEPLPDLALLRFRGDFYTRSHPLPEEVLLLVEVVEGSAEFERDVKLPLYAGAGIAEVWLIDAENGLVEVCRRPAAGGWSVRNQVADPRALEVAGLPGVVFDLSDLF